jgi:hypothetical protein
VIRILLAAEGDFPPTTVMNSGVSGEFIRRLLDRVPSTGWRAARGTDRETRGLFFGRS